MSKVSEVESPTLKYDRVWNSFARNGRDWICAPKIRSLFELGNASQIRLVAKAKGDRTTYAVEVEVDQFGDTCLLAPIQAMLYDLLQDWLDEQINAGRPHIGVRIIK